MSAFIVWVTMALPARAQDVPDLGAAELSGPVLWGLVGLLFISSTSFIKLSVVFTILRSALGLTAIPSTAIIAALAFVLSLLVMAPVGEAMWDAVTAGEPDSHELRPLDLALVERAQA